MSVTRSGDHRVRAFMVRLPSGAGYWTVLDEDLAVVAAADAFLRQVRFGRDGAESTTKAYAGAIALFLRWCARTGRDWQAGAAHLGLFMTWLLHAGPQGSGAGAFPGAAVLTGPGSAPARSARRGHRVRGSGHGRRRPGGHRRPGGGPRHDGAGGGGGPRPGAPGPAAVRGR